MSITDVSNNLVSLITFDSQKNQRTGYWTSWVKGADKINKDSGVLDNRKDLLSIVIQENSSSAKPTQKAEGFGSYLEHITFDKQPLWTVNDTQRESEWIVPDPSFILESDSSKRQDRVFILQKKWEEAETAKHELEELQRKDKRSREEATKT